MSEKQIPQIVETVVNSEHRIERMERRGKMSGFELLAEWRGSPRTADLPVFVLTSKDLTKEEEKYIHAHAESLFRKQNSWREPLIKQLERVITSQILEDA